MLCACGCGKTIRAIGSRGRPKRFAKGHHIEPVWRQPRDVAERFWEKVDRWNGDGCWLWTAARNASGYGVFAFNVGANDIRLAHRVAYELVRGPIPPGRIICHACDNPSCCRPEHLFEGSNQDNTDDLMAKGRYVPRRHAEGEAHAGAKLRRAIVLDARASHAAGETFVSIARRHAVGVSAIRRAVRGETWRHVSSGN